MENKEENLQLIKDTLVQFRDERDWMQFHKPKDLAMAISVESAELLEKFLWKNEEEINQYLDNPEKRAGVVDELADVFITALNLANILGINVTAAVMEKIEKNNTKYPVDKARGTAKKYSEL